MEDDGIADLLRGARDDVSAGDLAASKGRPANAYEMYDSAARKHPKEPAERKRKRERMCK